MTTNKLPDPIIRKGDPIRAGMLCDVARAATRTSVQPGQYQSNTVNLQRRLKGGSKKDTTFATNLAIVTGTASANGGIGTCVRLDSDLVPIAVLDPGDPLYDPDAVGHASIEFVCAHQYCGCPVGERIMLCSTIGLLPSGGGGGGGLVMMLLGFVASLFGVPVVFGQFSGDDHEGAEIFTFGLLTDCIVELRQRAGFGADTALVGGAAETDISWAGGSCPPPE